MTSRSGANRPSGMDSGWFRSRAGRARIRSFVSASSGKIFSLTSTPLWQASHAEPQPSNSGNRSVSYEQSSSARLAWFGPLNSRSSVCPQSCQTRFASSGHGSPSSRPPSPPLCSQDVACAQRWRKNNASSGCAKLISTTPALMREKPPEVRPASAGSSAQGTWKSGSYTVMPTSQSTCHPDSAVQSGRKAPNGLTKRVSESMITT
mmetsp:Transcript_78211/g.224153  ORF Transcript_78211/g.224153 Transcript_78211/m.224153 type:complete len:206 (-) Transcript_78211:354-971(-)